MPICIKLKPTKNVKLAIIWFIRATFSLIIVRSAPYSVDAEDAFLVIASKQW